MDEPTLHVASGLNLWRAVKYPEVTDFAFFLDEEPEVMFMDIHDTTPQYKAKQAKYPPIYTATHGKDNILLSQFVYVSRTNGSARSFWAHPAGWLVNYTAQSSFTGGGLKVVNHIGEHAGWSLVIFDESQIIGGAWLAYVRTETVPTP
jgi:hypothetical protein